MRQRGDHRFEVDHDASRRARHWAAAGAALPLLALLISALGWLPTRQDAEAASALAPQEDAVERAGIADVRLVMAPPQAVLVGETVSASLSLVATFVASQRPFHAVVVWEPPRPDADEGEMTWRARVRDYLAERLTDHPAFGSPQVVVVPATRDGASPCGPTASREMLHSCLARADAPIEPHLPTGLARVDPVRLAMRQTLTRTLGLHEAVIVVGDAAGVEDCEELADLGAAIARDDHPAFGVAFCATPACRTDCLVGFTGSRDYVREANAPFDGLLHPARDRNFISVYPDAAELQIAMGEGGRIESAQPSTDVAWRESKAVRWQFEHMPVEGVTVSWTARATRPGTIEWLDAVSFVVTDTLGRRIDTPIGTIPRMTGVALLPETLGGATRLWLPAMRR